MAMAMHATRAAAPRVSSAALADPLLEQALIGLVFTDNTNLGALDKLSPEDLTDPFLSAALAACLNMHAEGRPATLVTLKPRLEAMPLGDGQTGFDAIRALTAGSIYPAIGDVCHRLRSLAMRRRLVEAMTGLAWAAADEAQPLVALAADGIRQLNDYLCDAVEQTQTSFDLYEASQEFIEWVQSDGDPVEITTGLRDLDETTGGWHRGEFAILAGRPSMGKSAIALGSALRTAKAGHGVLFFSLEMTERQIVGRSLSDLSYADPSIAYSTLRPGRVSQDQIRRLTLAADVFRGMPMEVETRNGITVGDIMVRARKCAEEFKAKGTPLALIIVDHLLKVRPSNRYAGQSVKEIDEISEAMCVMAKTLGVAVLGLHQLNRQVESRDNQRPLLSDLRGSGTLEQDADVVLFVYRPAYQYERILQDKDADRLDAEVKLNHVRHDLELQVAKQRNGATRSLEFFVDMPANVVRDREWRDRR